MSLSERPDYVQQNVAYWSRANAQYTDASAAEAWAQEEIAWGVWQTPESELNVLGEVGALDIVELGCGTAYFSAWLARRGARVVGVDPTPAQLETARRLQRESGIEFPLIEAAGEDVPLPDASFDIVHSEYGASIWADPQRWIPEAARLARPGGRLIFMRNSTLVALCMAIDGITEQLVRPLRAMHRIEWPDTEEVEFHLPPGELIDLLCANGFQLDRLIELYAPEGAETHEYYKWVTAEWARRWPSEELWVATKASPGGRG
jgi:SAM-dependent methyltransferase